MSRITISMNEELYSYLQSVSAREPEILSRLRQETAQLPMAGMQISVEQGQFMRLLIRLMGARRTLEVGVFTGYSSLSVALALPPDGHITACDVNEEWTGVARRYWQAAGVAGKIDLRLGPAAETLRQLLEEGQAGAYDFAFIDADKENYDIYYEHALQLLRPGGLVAIDNTLWSGKVAKADVTDPSTEALRALNKKLHQDRRIELSLLPVGDGLTLGLKN